MSIPPAARDRILGHCSFPALPGAAVRLLQLGEHRAVGVDELSEIISADAALSAAILRAINSSFYGLRRKVTNVRQAVALLGWQSVQTLVLGLTLATALPEQPAGGIDLNAYWRRCVYTAAAARALASRYLPACVEECFISALLMDLGTLVMARTLAERYTVVWRRAKNHTDLLKLENETFDINHAEVGALVIRHWELPARLELPVAAHHAPQTVENAKLRSIAEILELSGRCAEVFLNPNAAEAIAAAREGLAVRHGAGLSEADKMLVRVGQKASELAPLLRVMLETADFGTLLEQATPRLLEIALSRQHTTGGNQRRSPRRNGQGSIALFPCTRGTLGRELRVRLCDLSANGIGVIHNRAMARGSQFVITLPMPGGSTKSFLYTAIRCAAVGSHFRIGAELRAVLKTGERESTGDEIESLSCGAD